MRQKLGTVCLQGALAVIIHMLAWGAGGVWASALGEDLTQLSLEDLMDIEITSVSKKVQRLSEAAAAVFVITADDIRRSGVTTIPEALRMVPGMQVAKMDSNKWAVSARGFNGRFASKLLVLMDGRSVYTPLFSGVFWEDIDTPLEDIERIEVIRGPGASLWGANAVNGVINIITKPAAETQGGLLSVGGGTEEQALGTVRYGGKLTSKTPYRLYLKYNDRDTAQALDGGQGEDDWDYLRGGFRLDHQATDRDSLVLQGDIYAGTTGETITEPTVTPPYEADKAWEDDHDGFSMLGRWSRFIDEDSDFSLQAYYDRSDYTLAVGGAQVDTVDLDFQHRFAWGNRQEIIWGMGYRFAHQEAQPNLVYLGIDDPQDDLNIASFFVQDEISLFSERLRLTLGSKVEYNNYTDWEIQPTARLLYKASATQSMWASVSRAVRIPSWGERDFDITYQFLPPGLISPDAPLTEVRVEGTGDQRSETLLAYELGYRIQLLEELSLDATAYYNVYDDLRNTPQGMPYLDTSQPPLKLVAPYVMDNSGDEEIYGFELAADWRPWEGGRVQGAYTFTHQDFEGEPASGNRGAASPEHQISLRTGIDLPRNVELDIWWRYVDDLGSQVEDYQILDILLGSHLRENL
ncbi:MAG: TonB-dependent receptor [Desulfobacterales bacterium]